MSLLGTQGSVLGEYFKIYSILSYPLVNSINSHKEGVGPGEIKIIMHCSLLVILDYMW